MFGKFFKHRYPMRVREFRQLASQCNFPETQHWHWLTEKHIAEALDRIGGVSKVRILKAKGVPKAEWPNITIARRDGKGTLTTAQAQTQAIHTAVMCLVHQLYPRGAQLGPHEQSLNFSIYCPECNARLQFKIQIAR